MSEIRLLLGLCNGPFGNPFKRFDFKMSTGLLGFKLVGYVLGNQFYSGVGCHNVALRLGYVQAKVTLGRAVAKLPMALGLAGNVGLGA